MNIIIINGPNLNLLGNREPEIYGKSSFEDYLDEIKKEFTNVKFYYYQTNVEGEIINLLQKNDENSDGILLNAAAYTHTSIGIADAVKAIKTPVIEIHISNVMAREDYRQISYIAPNCIGTISGFGLDSYRLGILAFLKEKKKK